MTTATLLLQIVDGAREPFSSDIMVRLFDGAQRLVHQAVHKSSRIRFILPFTDGPNDIFRIVVTADDHLDAGQAAVQLRGDAEIDVDVMMLPRRSGFRFEPLSSLGRVHPKLEAILRAFLRQTFPGMDDDGAYRQLQQENPGGLATLFSIASGFAGFGTASVRPATVDAAAGHHPLEFIEQLLELRNDRFFAIAQTNMIDRWLATAPRTFTNAPHSLHPGSFRSFKEVRYPEGNVQFTFSHRDDPNFVTVDSDIDLFGDEEGHLLIEVFPTDVLHLDSGTDPRQAYAFRWMSVQRAKAATGLDFDPPFAITRL